MGQSPATVPPGPPLAAPWCHPLPAAQPACSSCPGSARLRRRRGARRAGCTPLALGLLAGARAVAAAPPAAGDDAFLLPQSLHCEYRGASTCSRALQRARSVSSCVEAPQSLGTASGSAVGAAAAAPVLGAFDGLACGRHDVGEFLACRSLIDGGCQALQTPLPLASVSCRLGCARLRSRRRGGDEECTLDVDVSSAYHFETCDLRAMCSAFVEPSCAKTGGADEREEESFWSRTWVILAVAILLSCCLLLCVLLMVPALRRRWGYGVGRMKVARVAADPEADAGQRRATAPTAKFDPLAGLVGAVPTEPKATEVWEVVFAGSVNVRSAKSTDADRLTQLPRGVLVRGRQEGAWLALDDEPGFVLIADGSRTLLRKVEPGSRAEVVGLPVGWECARDASTGRTYYFDQKSGVTQWSRPVPSGGPPSAQPHAFGRASPAE
mmetsp:Transcript_71929/g.227325  ORF Transcript_71929/g.227325 Transcript_71929/m.227325 type:complete len:439 (-) Transcript_71929:78-1394(-)